MKIGHMKNTHRALCLAISIFLSLNLFSKKCKAAIAYIPPAEEFVQDVAESDLIVIGEVVSSGTYHTQMTFGANTYTSESYYILVRPSTVLKGTYNGDLIPLMVGGYPRDTPPFGWSYPGELSGERLLLFCKEFSEEAKGLSVQVFQHQFSRYFFSAIPIKYRVTPDQDAHIAKVIRAYLSWATATDAKVKSQLWFRALRKGILSGHEGVSARSAELLLRRSIEVGRLSSQEKNQMISWVRDRSIPSTARAPLVLWLLRNNLLKKDAFTIVREIYEENPIWISRDPHPVYEAILFLKDPRFVSVIIKRYFIDPSSGISGWDEVYIEKAVKLDERRTREELLRLAKDAKEEWRQKGQPMDVWIDIKLNHAMKLIEETKGAVK